MDWNRSVWSSRRSTCWWKSVRMLCSYLNILEIWMQNVNTVIKCIICPSQESQWYQNWKQSCEIVPSPSSPHPFCAGAVQSGDGFLSLLRHVQLFLALHRGPVPFHAAGWNVLSRETLLLLVHHCRMGWVSPPDFCLLILTIFYVFSSPQRVNNWLYCRNSHHLCNCLGSPEAPFSWHWV